MEAVGVLFVIEVVRVVVECQVALRRSREGPLDGGLCLSRITMLESSWVASCSLYSHRSSYKYADLGQSR